MTKKRRKRWLRNRQKDYHRTKFVQAFRECFVQRGIVEK